jgi:hypothetical protein
MEEIIRGRELELPQHSSISDGELILPTVGMEDMLAKVNIEPLLRATLLCGSAKRKKRGPGGPKNLEKEAVLILRRLVFSSAFPRQA